MRTQGTFDQNRSAGRFYDRGRAAERIPGRDHHRIERQSGEDLAGNQSDGVRAEQGVGDGSEHERGDVVAARLRFDRLALADGASATLSESDQSLTIDFRADHPQRRRPDHESHQPVFDEVEGENGRIDGQGILDGSQGHRRRVRNSFPELGAMQKVPQCATAGSLGQVERFLLLSARQCNGDGFGEQILRSCEHHGPLVQTGDGPPLELQRGQAIAQVCSSARQFAGAPVGSRTFEQSLGGE